MAVTLTKRAANRSGDATVERIVATLRERHSGEQIVYTGCSIEGHCVLKARLRDGRVVAIEPDDRFNTGIGREDRVLSDRDLVQARVQHRCCPPALMWHKHLHDPNRLLYPLKRRLGSKRGDGDFERISWDEALDTIVAKMVECRDRHGRYSIMTPFLPNTDAERLFGFWGAGVGTWGACSCDAERLSSHLTTGRLPYEGYRSSSAGDALLNAKLIVLWGLDPTVTHIGPGHQFAWYLRLARERRTPIICIDPRYTMAAEMLADQWLPIKPGTDMAMILAIAHVLFEEELYDQQFVARFVEPEGFARWRGYVLGEQDGLPKTPSWAEAICGVPAQTIAEFARLYARSKPTWLFKNWSVARKSHGENAARGAATLQAIMGYFGIPGGILPYFIGGWPTATRLPLGEQPRGYDVPKVCRSHKWAQAVLLNEEVKRGRMSSEEWRAIVGYAADPALPIPEEFNPHFLWWGQGWGMPGANHLSTQCDSSIDQIRALDRMDFVLHMHTAMTPTARYADLVLPSIDRLWEDVAAQPMLHIGSFSTISCVPGVIPPQGEARHAEWVMTKIADRLGFAKQYNPYYTDDEHWQEDFQRYHRLSYENAAKQLPFDTPSWEELRAGKFVAVDAHMEKPFVGFEREIVEGKPFPTESGKFEIYSKLLADETRRGQLHEDHLGRPMSLLPNDWRDLQPMPVYQPALRGLEDALGSKYPLMLLTAHSRYRYHSLFWTVPWLRGDVYRHAVWLSTADAKKRGIVDGDQVRVFNDKGEIFVPVYVTSRIMPGVALVHQGAWYDRDSGTSVSVVLGDKDSPVTPAPATTLVEIEKEARR